MAGDVLPCGHGSSGSVLDDTGYDLGLGAHGGIEAKEDGDGVVVGTERAVLATQKDVVVEDGRTKDAEDVARSSAGDVVGIVGDGRAFGIGGGGVVERSVLAYDEVAGVVVDGVDEEQALPLLERTNDLRRTYGPQRPILWNEVDGHVEVAVWRLVVGRRGGEASVSNILDHIVFEIDYDCR